MKKLSLLFLILFCSLHHAVFAQNPGDLDNSFGMGGQVIISGAPWMDVAVQSDGKVLAVSNIIARYSTDGTLDGTFGVNGIDTIKIGDTIYYGSAIGIQPDGKILVAGEPAGLNPDLKDFLLIRYNADGSPDSSFDGDGVVRTDLDSGFEDYGYELAIQTDGKIIVAGASGERLALSRYHSDGSLDSTFDQDGKLVINSVYVNFNSNWADAVYMKLQIDGKILAGSMGFLARLNPDGSLDNSFGTNGVGAYPSIAIKDLAIRPDGKIVLAGGNGISFAIVRLDTNGSLDSNFGNGGTVITPPQYWNISQEATSIALQPDGRILAGGYNWACLLNDCREFVLIRYNQNGSIDSSFGSDGRVTTSFSQSSSDESHASVITPDLKIVLAGYAYDLNYGCLAQYHLGWLLDVNTVGGTDESFVIAPNPATDWINIKASNIENGLWHLEIRDITGRLLQREDIVATDGAIQKRVSLNDLPTGLYLLQLDNGEEKMISKVIKCNN